MIELLVVAAVLGLLTAMAAVQVQAFRERAYMAVMKSDLRHMAVAQESHFYDYMVYAGDPRELEPRGWRPTEGVSIEVLEATLAGWSAEARRVGSEARCYLFIRAGAPVGLASREGVVACG
jgi:Tfp pilus assembly protein PilE